MEPFCNCVPLVAALFDLPMAELLFAFAFGAHWSDMYEYLTWKRLQAHG